MNSGIPRYPHFTCVCVCTDRRGVRTGERTTVTTTHVCAESARAHRASASQEIDRTTAHTHTQHMKKGHICHVRRCRRRVVRRVHFSRTTASTAKCDIKCAHHFGGVGTQQQKTAHRMSGCFIFQSTKSTI